MRGDELKINNFFFFQKEIYFNQKTILGRKNRKENERMEEKIFFTRRKNHRVKKIF